MILLYLALLAVTLSLLYAAISIFGPLPTVAGMLIVAWWMKGV